MIINPSRAAILCSDQWGTVSKSYRTQILEESPLKFLLSRFDKVSSISLYKPFATSNGIAKWNHRINSKKISKNKTKEEFLHEYFDYSDEDESPNNRRKRTFGEDEYDPQELDCEPILFAFIGRICEQKGALPLLNVIESILAKGSSPQVKFFLGGPINQEDPYGEKCAEIASILRRRFPSQFYFDTKNAVPSHVVQEVNVFADFGLVPSIFEPGGLTQMEFLVADTPVICSETGGLKDTVVDIRKTPTGNGLLFKADSKSQLRSAILTAIKIFREGKPYEALCRNCFDSVIDLGDTAKEYIREFCRLKETFFIDSFRKIQENVSSLSIPSKDDELIIKVPRWFLRECKSEVWILIKYDTQKLFERRLMQFSEPDQCWFCDITDLISQASKYCLEVNGKIITNWRERMIEETEDGEAHLWNLV